MTEPATLTDDDIDSFFCAVPGPDQSLIVAYEAEDEGDLDYASRIARLDRQGRILWLQDGIEFEQIDLRISPNGRHLAFRAIVRDDDGQTSDLIQLLDPGSGEPIATLAGPAALSERGIGEIYPADDGTVIFEYKPINQHVWELARYDRQDQPLPLWSSAGGSAGQPVREEKKGFFKRLGEKRGEQGDRVDFTWSRLSSGSSVLPEACYVKLGADGGLYLLDKNCRYFGRFDPAGNLVERRQPAALPIDYLLDFAVDPDGTLYILFRHEQEIGGATYPHIARMRPGQEPEVWIGPHAKDSPSFLAQTNGEHICLSADGLLYLDGDFCALRAIDRDGKTVWLGPETAEADREAREDL